MINSSLSSPSISSSEIGSLFSRKVREKRDRHCPEIISGGTSPNLAMAAIATAFFELNLPV